MPGVGTMVSSAELPCRGGVRVPSPREGVLECPDPSTHSPAQASPASGTTPT